MRATCQGSSCSSRSGHDRPASDLSVTPLKCRRYYGDTITDLEQLTAAADSFEQYYEQRYGGLPTAASLAAAKPEESKNGSIHIQRQGIEMAGLQGNGKMQSPRAAEVAHRSRGAPVALKGSGAPGARESTDTEGIPTQTSGTSSDIEPLGRPSVKPPQVSESHMQQAASIDVTAVPPASLSLTTFTA